MPETTKEVRRMLGILAENGGDSLAYLNSSVCNAVCVTPGEMAALLRDLEAAEKLAADRLELLRAVEYRGGCCAWCGGRASDGHCPQCRLAAALRG